MENKAQSNAKRLINLLLEDKNKKKKAPFVIAFIIIVTLCSLYAMKLQVKNKKIEYYIGRTQFFNLNDYQSAKENGIDLSSLGKNGNHIIFYISEYKYDLTLLNEMKKSGLNFKKENDNGLNILEQVLNELEINKLSLTGPFQSNLKTLIKLGFEVSDENVRVISKKCEKNNPMTCLKMAYYFKALGKIDHSKSYAKRTCYQPINEELCQIAKDNF